nr:hypothetical protein asmbl_24 [uncultured bacterium]
MRIAATDRSRNRVDPPADPALRADRLDVVTNTPDTPEFIGQGTGQRPDQRASRR